MKNVFPRYRQLVIILLPVFFFSCSGTGTIAKTQFYNDSVYQQLWSADWSPDNKIIAVGGTDSLLRIYHAKDLRLYKSFPLNSWIHSVKWHNDSKVLAIATLDKYVLLLNIENGSITALNSKGGSRAIGWNYNGQLLAVGDLDGTIKIWDIQGRLLRIIKKEYGPDASGTAFLGLDWHPFENSFIATNFQISQFDTGGHVLKVMEHTNKQAIILCVSWHPSGSFFVIGDYGHNWGGENVPSLLHFWNSDGKLIRSVPGSKAEYRSIAWNKEGTLLATASDVLRIWSNKGVLLYQGKPDSSNYLWGIDWNGRNKKIVTTSRHKSVALWNRRAKLLKRIDIGK